MVQTLTINGHDLYFSLTAAYEQLKGNYQLINRINVFPVADGDTGSNILHTLQEIVAHIEKLPSFAQMSDAIARSALFGARGNSGMILAEFFHGFHLKVSTHEELHPETLITAAQSAVKRAVAAVEDPKEGTILTVMQTWADALSDAYNAHMPMALQLRRALRAAIRAERETMEQMQVLKQSHVVDAGAKAFVTMLKGVDAYLVSGNIDLHTTEQPVTVEVPEDHHQGYPTYRFCTEALLEEISVESAEIRRAVSDLGDSLVIGSHADRMRFHIHTDDPQLLYRRLRGYGTIVSQKIDDMLMQHRMVQSTQKTVIVTDSSADIPEALKAEYAIYTIDQRLQIDGESFYDRITMDTPTLLETVNRTGAHASSSMPSLGQLQHHFSFLAEHFDSIIVISVSAALSGTFHTYERAAESLIEKGYPIHIIDSKLNATAQGLVTIEAARLAQKGHPPKHIIDTVSSLCDRSRIFVSVQSLDMMVQSGRVPQKLGKLLAGIKLKPLISLSPTGSGSFSGLHVSRTGSVAALVSRFMKAHRHSGISSYAISYAQDRTLAETLASEIRKRTGMDPVFIEEVSPVIALHAGTGAISLGYCAAV